MKYPIEIKGKSIKQVTKLNLSGKNLSVFPENVFDYSNLTKLVLSNNRIKVIPKDILKLKKLKVLDMANNEIKVLQGAVFRLPKLQTLNLYGNQIKTFPKQFAESSIRKVVVSMNPLEEGELERLREKCEVVSTMNEQTSKVEVPTTKTEMPMENNVNNINKTKQEKKMEKKHSIFISYSHEDDEWLKKVRRNLKSLQRYYDNVKSWSDQEIMASDVWKDEIDKALRGATIAILLISPDFMASDFITNEELQPILNKAVVEGTKILSLILRPTAMLEESGILKYQAINDPKKPLSGMTEFEQEITLVKMVETITKIIKKKQNEGETGKREPNSHNASNVIADEEEVRDIVRKYKVKKR